MALFNKESKEDKQERKMQEIMDKYGLENVSDPLTAKALRDIATTMTSSNLMTVGVALSGKAEDVAKISCLGAIIEQNFIIIRQLDKLTK